MSDIFLVSMPCERLEYPSLGISLLLAAAKNAGLSARIMYPRFWFAENIDYPHYMLFSSNLMSRYMLGEWVFAQAAFPDFDTDNDRIFNQVEFDWLMQFDVAENRFNTLSVKTVEDLKVLYHQFHYTCIYLLFDRWRGRFFSIFMESIFCIKQYVRFTCKIQPQVKVDGFGGEHFSHRKSAVDYYSSACLDEIRMIICFDAEESHSINIPDLYTSLPISGQNL